MLYCCWLVLLAASAAAAQPAPPDAWDPRALGYGGCPGFVPADQGSCNSCCAAALARSASVRACMRDGRAVLFGARHVWDCAGADVASCADGVLVPVFVQDMTQGPGAPEALLPVAAAGVERVDAEPNSTACYSRRAGAEPLEAAVTHTTQWGLVAGGGAAAAVDLQWEVWANGPAMAVLLLSAADFQSFAAWRAPLNRSWHPTNVTDDVRIRHCLVVYGWGPGVWLVQNSFGLEWGDGGFASLPRGVGLLEAEWYAFITRPCPSCPGSRTGVVPTTTAAAATNNGTAIIMMSAPRWPSSVADIVLLAASILGGCFLFTLIAVLALMAAERRHDEGL